MPIENRELTAGTRLVARYKKQDRTCEVVETPDGLRYRLDDGTEHRSPSSAGKAATGGACNGWRFWSVESAEKPKRESTVKTEGPKRKPAAKKEATSKKPAKTKAAKKNKAKRGMDGKNAAMASAASFGCSECGESFPTQEEATEHATTHAS